MDFFIPVLAATVGLILIIFLAVAFLGRTKGWKRSSGRDAILKHASRALEQNPRDPRALAELGDLYYREESWDLAFRTYGTLVEMGQLAPSEFDANLRF
ncbi:MAG: hypothetical protein FWC65_05635, partial [Treponema sp.]|nr:hypothetical protein [Treponema sp.]